MNIEIKLGEKNIIQRTEFSKILIKENGIEKEYEQDINHINKTIENYNLYKDQLLNPEKYFDICSSKIKGINNKSIEYVYIPLSYRKEEGSKYKYIINEISSSSFYNNQTIKTLIISDGVLEIGVDAFCNCVNLETIKMPSKLVEIRGGSFRNCISLEEVEFYNVKSIGFHCFNNCIKLKK